MLAFILLGILIITYIIVNYYLRFSPLNVEGKTFMVAGLKGSGKSYYLSYLAKKFIKKGNPVFCNFPVWGAYELEFDYMTKYLFPKGSVILYDEAHNELDSDNHKARHIKDSLIMFTQSRKLGYTVGIASQNPVRVVKALRDITDYFIWACGSRGGIFDYVVYLSYDHFIINHDFKSFKVLDSNKIRNSYLTEYLHNDITDRSMCPMIPWEERSNPAEL